jgi:pheromone a factor receptor
VDSLICIGGPLLQVGLCAYYLIPGLYILLTPFADYIVQGHRYNILEDVGCWPALVWTLPTLFVFQLWPIIIGCVSAFYCGMLPFFQHNREPVSDVRAVLSLHALFQRQAQFSQFLASNKAVSASRYMRLMALAGTEVLCTVPIALVMLVVNCQQAFGPDVRADVHFDFSQVDQLPTFQWAASNWTIVAIQLTRWSAPLCALVFFAFFGFAEEARRNYANALRCVFGPLSASFGWLSGWYVSTLLHHAVRH